MCRFEAEWERLLREREKLLCNAITLREIRSVDPVSVKNRDEIVSLHVEFFFENSLRRSKNLCQLSSRDHREAGWKVKIWLN